MCVIPPHPPPSPPHRERCKQLTNVTLGISHTASIRTVRDPQCPSSSRGVQVSWFEADLGPGTVSFTAAPVGVVFSSIASIGLETTAWPGTTYFQYSLDGSTWTTCGPSLRVGPLSPGPHVLVARSTDGASVSANVSVAWSVLSQSSYQLQVGCACRGTWVVWLCYCVAVRRCACVSLSLCFRLNSCVLNPKKRSCRG